MRAVPMHPTVQLRPLGTKPSMHPKVARTHILLLAVLALPFQGRISWVPCEIVTEVGHSKNRMHLLALIQALLPIVLHLVVHFHRRMCRRILLLNNRLIPSRTTTTVTTAHPPTPLFLSMHRHIPSTQLNLLLLSMLLQRT